MNFALTEEQRLLKQVAQDWLANRCSKTYVRDMELDERGYAPELWNEMTENGWLGLVYPEQYGGMAMSFVDQAVLLEEMGRACLPGPYFSTLMAGLTIVEAGSDAQKSDLIERMANGQTIATLAHTECDGSWDAGSVTTRAEADGRGFVLSGVKLYVPDAHVADVLVVSARTAWGVGLFVVDKGSEGLRVTPLRTISGDKWCEVTLEGVKVPGDNLLGDHSDAVPALERALLKAAVAKCAESVGGAQQVLDITVAYTKERVQFKRPISSLQVIQHYCANMATSVDACRFITYQAAWRIAEGLPASKEAAIAKAWTNEAYRKVCALGQQIHGAVGFTMEHDMQLYYRRAKVAEAMLGDAGFHRERVARAMAL